MELLLINVEDCRKARLGGRSGVWFGSRRSLSRQVGISALGARDWEEISTQMIIEAIRLVEIT